MTAGRYLVRLTVDPADHIAETDETNNVGYALIEVVDGGGPGQDTVVVCEQGMGSDPADPDATVVADRFAWTSPDGAAGLRLSAKVATAPARNLGSPDRDGTIHGLRPTSPPAAGRRSRRSHPMATTAPAADRPHEAAKRYIYAWGAGGAEGDATMRDLLGGKGAGLAEMTKAGLPTPPGFTITTEACNDYFAAGEQLPDGLWDDVLAAVREVEQRTGKGFGDPANPLLVSVRSGAKFSMPGMMDTVLNLGLNEATLQGLVALTGNERFGWDAYRRFIQMFGRIVMEVSGERFDHALEAAKAAHGADAGHGPRCRRAARPRRPSSSRSSRPTPAATSRTTRTSSWTSPSRRSSPAGSASAPTTTARTRPSRTTWARRSTS